MDDRVAICLLIGKVLTADGMMMQPEREVLDQRTLELDGRASVVAAAERDLTAQRQAWERRRANLEKDVEGLENRIRNQRLKLTAGPAPTASPSSGTALPGDQTAAMSNMMSIYMPLLLGYFAITFASGLSVYFITSNVLGIIQYAMQGKANWHNLIPGFLRQKK